MEGSSAQDPGAGCGEQKEGLMERTSKVGTLKAPEIPVNVYFTHTLKTV